MNHILIACQFSLGGFTHITKKTLCKPSFLCLSFRNSIYSTSEFVELWDISIKLRYLLKKGSN